MSKTTKTPSAAAEIPSRRIQSIKITKIKPYWRNPRDNADATQAVALHPALRLQRPYSGRQKDGDHRGDTRYRAALILEMDEVPVIGRAT